MADNTTSPKDRGDSPRVNASSTEDGGGSLGDENKGADLPVKTIIANGENTDGKEKEDLRKYAVIHKIELCVDSSTRFKTLSLIIQSPLLEELVRKVLAPYPEIEIGDSPLELKDLLECLVAKWKEFQDESKRFIEQNPKAEAQVKMFDHLIGGLLQPAVNSQRGYFKDKKVSFDDLSTVYPPGCTVLEIRDDRPRAFRVTQGKYEDIKSGKTFTLECQYFDRELNEGWFARSVNISHFNGLKELASLPLYPIEQCEHPERVKQQLLDQAKKVGELENCQFREYNGTAASSSTCNPDIEVKGHIMIDWKHYPYDSPERGTFLHSVDDDNYLPREVSSSDESSSSSESSSSGESSSQYKAWKEDIFKHVNPFVYVYSFQLKIWLKVHINDIINVQFDPNALKSLAVPEGAKKSLTDLAEPNPEREILSKAIILFGGCDESRMSAANDVAEKAKKPLYAINALDFCTSPGGVKPELDKTLQMLLEWNAWLLIEHCHEFLVNSELWHTFRECLKHFKGYIFFSGNEIGSLDPGLEDKIVLDLD